MNRVEMNGVEEDNRELPQDYYKICGKSTLKEAEVIFLTDFFADLIDEDENSKMSLINRAKNVNFINHIWSGQTVLVEKCPYGSEIDIAHGIDPKISKNLKFWDEEDFCVRMKELDLKGISIFAEAKTIKDHLDKKKYSLLFNEKNGFASKTFVSLVETSSEELIQESLEIKKAFDLKHFNTFGCLMRRVIKKIATEHYQNVCKLYKEFFQKKLAVLKSTIEEEIKLKNLVIVVLNGSLILKNGRLHGEEFNLSFIHRYLFGKKYVVVSAKNSCHRMSNMPKLWDQNIENSQK